MSKKPTYENLEQRVKEFEKEIEKHKQAEDALHQYKDIVSSSTDMLAFLDRRFNYLAANKAYIEAFKLTPEQLIGNTVVDVFGEEFFNTVIKPNSDRCLGGEEVNYQNWFDFPALGWRYMDITYCPYYNEDNKITGFVVNGRDITERKQAEEALAERTRELELKTKSLEELNTAMKVLLKKRAEDKIEVEENVMTNVKELILPYFDKINQTKLDDYQKAFLNILESNLDEIVSPFTRKLSLKYLSLTPKEITIVNMIKIGYQSKKIAKLMKISPRTVDTHRKNIRSKIGLGKKRANLRSHLLAHEQ